MSRIMVLPYPDSLIVEDYKIWLANAGYSAYVARSFKGFQNHLQLRHNRRPELLFCEFGRLGIIRGVMQEFPFLLVTPIILIHNFNNQAELAQAIDIKGLNIIHELPSIGETLRNIGGLAETFFTIKDRAAITKEVFQAALSESLLDELVVNAQAARGRALELSRRAPCGLRDPC